MFPTTSETLYCPPCRRVPVVAGGNCSFGPFGTRPELFTTNEEFSTPVPLPLPTNSVRPTTASADGYCPVGIKPRTVLRSSHAPSDSRDIASPRDFGESSTTATEL